MPADAPTRREKPRVWVAVGVLVVAGVIAYANSLRGPFVFDDLASITRNPTVTAPTHWWSPLFPPADFGLTVAGRPIVNFSLALNHALSGSAVWSYHAFNLLVHVLAGVTLFGLVRRLLELPSLHGRWAASAIPAAFGTALLWLLHPLQTEAVTYVVQRAESLMALFYLLTLYAAVRFFAVDPPMEVAGAALRPSDAGSGREISDLGRNGNFRTWRALAVAACAVGMGCKEVMATAPVAVWLLDGAFGAGSLRRALRLRAGWYAALASTWVLLVACIASTGGNRGGSYGFTTAMIARHWLAQPEALLLYLRLVVWPVPLVFDYGAASSATLSDAWAGLLAFVALIGLSLIGWRRRRPEAIAGALFLLVLAPTFITPSATQPVAEHRMYLPLAAALVVLVAATVRWLGPRAMAGVVAVALLLGALTWRRNEVYASDLTLWQQTARVRPANARAQANLGQAWYERNRFENAGAAYAGAVRLDPDSALNRYNFALCLVRLGRPAEAVGHFAAAVRLESRFVDARLEWGATLIGLHRPTEALPILRDAIALTPAEPRAQLLLGNALSALGRSDEAIACFERALALRPEFAEAACNLGAALWRRGEFDAARQQLEAARRWAPGHPDVRFNLGLVLAAQGRLAEARDEYAAAVRVEPTHALARLNYGIALAQTGRLDEAQAQLAAGCALAPDLPEMHANLGLVLLQRREGEAAVQELETAVRLRPGYPAAQFGLGQALIAVGRPDAARAHVLETLRLEPAHAGAQDLLKHWSEVAARPAEGD